MKEVKLINILEKISSDEGYCLSFEEEIQLKEAFSHIPLLDEKPGEKCSMKWRKDYSVRVYYLRNLRKRLFIEKNLSVVALIAVLFGCGLWIKSLDMKYVTGSNEQLVFGVA